MFRYGFILSLLVMLLESAGISARELHLFPGRDAKKLRDLNSSLAGQILDLTHNHGCDRRMYSPSLGEKRDLYIYLPPGYDGRTLFPIILWLHPLNHDEQSFLDVAPHVDHGIQTGRFPACILVAPDGSISGEPSLRNAGSFYTNSQAGRFEDYVMRDVWGFAKKNFAVLPERESHMIAGISMGGLGAYTLAFKHRTEFAHIAGVMPPLDLRYADCHGKYFTDYDPTCRGERTVFERNEVIGQFHKIIRIRSKRLLDPLTGHGFDDSATLVRNMNPKDQLLKQRIGPNEFNMYIGYGTEDEFNVDAQVLSFLEATQAMGIAVTVVKVNGGHHSRRTVEALVPSFSQWVSANLGGSSPTPAVTTPCHSKNASSGNPLCAVQPRPCLISASSPEMESGLQLIRSHLR